MNDNHKTEYQSTNNLIENIELQGLSQIDIEKLRLIYQTVDKETQKKDVTKITSRSSADAIMNALRSGYKLVTDYDPSKYKSLVKMITDKIKDNEDNQDSLK